LEEIIQKKFKEINPFNNVIFPFCISLLGLYLALNLQRCNTYRIDRVKEKQYITSLKADLSKDQVKLDAIIAKIERTIVGLDSALEQMQKPMTDIKEVKLNYILIMKYDWFPAKVNFTEGTLTQLKYTGGLGLIVNSEVADSIALYDGGINLCNQDGSFVAESYKETFSTQKYVYNYKDRIDFQNELGAKNSSELQNMSNDFLVGRMNDHVKMSTTNKSLIIACYNDFANYQASLKSYTISLIRQKRITKNLIGLINKKYKLDQSSPEQQ
jgi:hypothetical protein